MFLLLVLGMDNQRNEHGHCAVHNPNFELQIIARSRLIYPDLTEIYRHCPFVVQPKCKKTTEILPGRF